jgi:hypothetical protein
MNNSLHINPQVVPDMKPLDRDGNPCDNIYQESILSGAKIEVGYDAFIRDFKSTLDLLRAKFNTSIIRNSVKILDTYPCLYTISTSDWRVTSLSTVSNTFRTGDLSSSSGLSVNTVAGELFDILAEVTDKSDYFQVYSAYTGLRDNVVQVYMELEDRFYLEDLMTSKNKDRETINMFNAKTEIDSNIKATINGLRMHPLAKLIDWNPNSKEYMTYEGGVVLPISETFSDKVFKATYPDMNGLGGALNLTYLAEAKILGGTHLNALPIARKNNSLQMFLKTRAEITVKF